MVWTCVKKRNFVILHFNTLLQPHVGYPDNYLHS